jgi:hypothetical protein
LYILPILLAAIVLSEAPAAPEPNPVPPSNWYAVDARGNVRVHLYLFWSRGCPRCRDALAFTDDLEQRHPWVHVYAYEITGNPDNRELYRRMAADLNRQAGQTPAFFYCKQMEVGYGSYEATGRRIEREMIRWYDILRKYYQERPPSQAATGAAWPAHRPAGWDSHPNLPRPPGGSPASRTRRVSSRVG